jgi:hypothetical protein
LKLFIRSVSGYSGGRVIIMHLRSSLAYGLETDDTALRIVRARRGLTGLRIDRLYEGPADLPAAERALEEVRQAQASGRAAAGWILPAREMAHRRVEAPVRARRRAERVLPAQLDILLPFPLEHGRHRFTAFRATDTGWSAFAVAAPDDVLREACARAPAGAWVFDAEALAAWSAARRAGGLPPTGPAAVSVLAPGRWMLAYGRDGLPDGVIAGRAPASGAGPELWAEWARDWAARARRTLRAAGLEEEPLVWFWTGAAARGTVLREVHAALAAPQARHIADPEPVWTLAAEAARRLTAPRGHTDNLRLGPWEADGVSAWRTRRMRHRQLAAGCAGLLLAGAAAHAHVRQARRLEQVDTTLAAEAARASGGARATPGREVEQARAWTDARLAESAALRAHTGPPASTALVRLLAPAFRAGTRLEQVAWNGAAWTAEGAALDDRAARALGDELEAVGWTVAVQRDAPDAEGRVRFRLEAQAP